MYNVTSGVQSRSTHTHKYCDFYLYEYVRSIVGIIRGSSLQWVRIKWAWHAVPVHAQPSVAHAVCKVTDAHAGEYVPSHVQRSIATVREQTISQAAKCNRRAPCANTVTTARPGVHRDRCVPLLGPHSLWRLATKGAIYAPLAVCITATVVHARRNEPSMRYRRRRLSNCCPETQRNAAVRLRLRIRVRVVDCILIPIIKLGQLIIPFKFPSELECLSLGSRC